MGDNTNLQPRCEISRGSGSLEVDWLGPPSIVDQQLSSTVGSDFPKVWGGKHPYFSEPPGVDGGSKNSQVRKGKIGGWETCLWGGRGYGQGSGFFQKEL